MKQRSIAVGLTAMVIVAACGTLAAAPPAAPSVLARGESVYKTHCIACHGAGIGNPGLEYKPGTDALRAKYNGQVPPVLSDRKDLDPAYVSYAVRNGVTLMPFFRKTDISDADLVALSSYLTRNNPKQSKK